MQFFSSSQFPSVHSTLPQALSTRLPAGVLASNGNGSVAARKLDCGWYDSSFDLARGLEVTEEDNDTIYQLWDLSRA